MPCSLSENYVRLGEALPANHLARFVVDVVTQLNLKPIYQRYKAVGGAAIAPSVLLSLLFWGYATGKFSSRKIEKATHEDLGYRYVAGGLHSDHDTIDHFRKTFCLSCRV
jgi:transposase